MMQQVRHLYSHQVREKAILGGTISSSPCPSKYIDLSYLGKSGRGKKDGQI